jgi:hypothetical protein
VFAATEHLLQCDCHLHLRQRLGLTAFTDCFDLKMLQRNVNKGFFLNSSSRKVGGFLVQ